jgi:hypothetical protein
MLVAADQNLAQIPATDISHIAAIHTANNWHLMLSIDKIKRIRRAIFMVSRNLAKKCKSESRGEPQNGALNRGNALARMFHGGSLRGGRD